MGMKYYFVIKWRCHKTFHFRTCSDTKEEDCRKTFLDVTVSAIKGLEKTLDLTDWWLSEKYSNLTIRLKIFYFFQPLIKIMPQEGKKMGQT